MKLILMENRVFAKNVVRPGFKWDKFIQKTVGPLDNLEVRLKNLENDVAWIMRFLKTGKKSEPKKKKGPTVNSKIFRIYAEAYNHRYNCYPPTGAREFSLIKQMVTRIGEEEASRIVKFYVWQNDAFFLKKGHDLAICLANLTSLVNRIKTGKIITDRNAKAMERQSGTESGIKSYLKGKYGKTT